ncbi:terminase small subunit [Oceanobacillus sp. 1P07AA]|uniref:terminase small subunit n=1 Tax=Oceanobacillus sp. 1P07AA TaxID=3132293 RepID=UPI0039A5B6EE
MNWDSIREEWENSKITLKDLAAKHDIKIGTLKSRKSRERWSRGSPKKDAIKSKKVATPKEKDAPIEKVEIDAPELTDKQKRFVEEYIIDLNATQSAIRAGYSEKSAKQQGSYLLTNPNVLTYIKKLREEQKEKLFLDSLWVLERLSQVVDRSMQAEPVMTFDYATKEMIPTGEYQYDSTGANRALELIGRHLMMFDPKAKNIDEMTKAQIEKIMADTEFTKARTQLLKGQKKDTGLLDALIEGRKRYEQAKD